MIPPHGQQQLSGFHGYYDEHCYLPLSVSARGDGGPDELRAAKLRAARGFARPEVYQFCATQGLAYLIGLITNPRLQQLAEP